MSTLERLYLEHEPRVRWIMHARGVEAASVDDLVHESFMTIHRRWARRDRSVPLATWIVRVARNVAFSHRRAEARRRRRLQEVPQPPAPAAPDEALAEQEAWDELDAFTRRLSPKLREVFVLADVGGVPVREIAETFGVPVATLHSRLRLSRERFAAHFERRRDAEERVALLRRAAAERTPTPEVQRRSMATLVAATKLPAAAAGAATSKVTSWVVAAVVVAVGGAAVVDRALDPQPETNAAATEVLKAAPPDEKGAVAKRSAEPASEPAELEPTEPVVPDRTTPATTRPGDTATPRHRAHDEPGAPAPQKPDPLAAHVAALERARGLTGAGQPKKALAVLDAVQDPASALAQDHQRVMLKAACAASLDARAHQAGRALAALGLRVDMDALCPAKQSEPIQ